MHGRHFETSKVLVGTRKPNKNVGISSDTIRQKSLKNQSFFSILNITI